MGSEAENILEELLYNHFMGEGLEWVWREGVTLEEKDPELYHRIKQMFPDIVKLKEGNNAAILRHTF